MAAFFKVVLRLAVVVLIAVGALFSWVFLYTRDLPDIEHLAEFAPDSGNLVTDACLPGLAFAIPFDRIGKPFQDAVAAAEPVTSFSDEIARTLMCTKMERSARYQLDVLRLSWHMLLVGRYPDHVSRTYVFNWAAPSLHAAYTRRHDQRLAQRMGVPIRRGSRLKRHAATCDTSWLGSLKWRIDPHRATELC